MRPALGHLAALLTAVIWGFTFVFSDLVMQNGLSSFETLLLRTLIAYLFFWIICPRRPRLPKPGLAALKAEAPYMLAGVSGMAVYYLIDYFALSFTTASFVSIIAGTVPLFVALALWAVHGEKPGRWFFLGFLVAIIGVILVSVTGGSGLQVSVVGFLLVAVGNLLWAVYTLTVRHLDNPAGRRRRRANEPGAGSSPQSPSPGLGEPAAAPGAAASAAPVPLPQSFGLQASAVSAVSASAPVPAAVPPPPALGALVTQRILDLRRIFFWALVALILLIPVFGFDVRGVDFTNASLLFPLIFLGIANSSLAYLGLNLAFNLIGTVKASVYLYFPPAVAMLAAYFLLGESISWLGIIGIAAIIAGLAISEWRRST